MLESSKLATRGRQAVLVTLLVLATAAVFVARSDSTPPASAQILTTTVTLSSAEIRDLHDTPVAVIPAQGVGKAIYPLWMIGYYNAGATPYTVTDFGLGYYYQGSSVALYYLYIDMLGQSTNQMNYETTNQGQAVAQSAGLNKAVVVSLPQASPTDGDGTLKIVTGYIVSGP
jgi:hypothetical protein